jgi:DHA2 family multidrug resistance protein
MGNATGMFNLLRNIGGSVGIAVAATLLARYEQFYQTSLAAHVTPYSSAWQMRYAGLKQTLVAKGINATQADHTALGMVYGMVRRQAGALAFNRIFFIIGLAFLTIIPLLLLLKRPSHQSDGGMGH